VLDHRGRPAAALTWDEVWGIKERAIARGLSRRTADVVPHLGVDEKAIAKRHRYLTVVADLAQSRVLYLAEDRKEASLDGFWATLTPPQRDGIEAISMDMWEPYIQSTRAHLEEADGKIVFDQFHVAKHLHDAVDHVRRAEHRALKQADDRRLTGTKYLWLMPPTERTPDQRTTFRTLQHTDIKVARAWALKERFRQCWDYTYCGAAQKFFDRWFWRATHSRLAPMAEVAQLIRRHLPNVLTYLRHGQETRVWGDSAYSGQRDVIRQHAPQAKSFVQAKAHRHQPLSEAERTRNHTKSKVRAKVEHACLVITRIFGGAKVRYRGLAKNTHWLQISCGLANRYVARRRLMAGA
jgi:hypothetical protein